MVAVQGVHRLQVDTKCDCIDFWHFLPFLEYNGYGTPLQCVCFLLWTVSFYFVHRSDYICIENLKYIVIFIAAMPSACD